MNSIYDGAIGVVIVLHCPVAVHQMGNTTHVFSSRLPFVEMTHTSVGSQE